MTMGASQMQKFARFLSCEFESLEARLIADLR
jgi:hypothetical protein